MREKAMQKLVEKGIEVDKRILSDPDMMEAIREGLEDMRAGRVRRSRPFESRLPESIG